MSRDVFGDATVTITLTLGTANRKKTNLVLLRGSKPATDKMSCSRSRVHVGLPGGQLVFSIILRAAQGNELRNVVHLICLRYAAFPEHHKFQSGVTVIQICVKQTFYNDFTKKSAELRCLP